MKNLKLLRNIDTFYKLAQSKIKSENEAENDFKMWEERLKGKIPTLMQKKSKFDEYVSIPICIVEAGKAIPTGGNEYEPAFLIRFIDPNRLSDPELGKINKMESARQVLENTSFNPYDYHLEESDSSKVINTKKNISYNQYIVVLRGRDSQEINRIKQKDEQRKIEQLSKQKKIKQQK